MPTFKEENSPFIQLLLLGFYALAGLLVFFLIALFFVFIRHGSAMLSDLSWLKNGGGSYALDLKILLTAQQLGFFLFPALLLAITERKRQSEFYGLKTPQLTNMFVVFLLMMVSIPMMEWINLTNQKMVFPGFLKGVENWMRIKEDESMATTLAILKMDSIRGFLLNIFVIAVVPGVCEEFIFRGALQRTLGRIFKSPHFAIWLAAFIFSCIHLQFFGFFPRLFLGAAFGYLYFWTGSIWYSVFAHFVNNAYAVCVAFYMQLNGLPMDQENTYSGAWYGYLISAILTFILFKFLKEKRINHEN